MRAIFRVLLRANVADRQSDLLQLRKFPMHLERDPGDSVFGRRARLQRSGAQGRGVHTLKLTAFVLACASCLVACGSSDDEDSPPSYLIHDPYGLPQPLVMEDGTLVKSEKAWFDQRRPETLALFAEHVYGKTPVEVPELTFEVVEEAPDALGGKAIRRQVRIALASDPAKWGMDLLLYLPVGATSSPVFLGLNFGGNHTVNADPAIRLTTSWVDNDEQFSTTQNVATEAGRGAQASRWPIEHVLERGYAVATVYYGDIDPDFDDFSNGVHPLFYALGQTEPAADEWGAIGAWSWGLSRALDYLVTDAGVDASRVAVMGHSRQGKAALWAGAQDTRFALVVSNDSGELGAALARRHAGETIAAINEQFPHWFAKSSIQYNENEASLPTDQHQMIALQAPRPVYIASGENDWWADPIGEFEGGKYGSVVYRLLGQSGLEGKEMPEVEQPILNRVGYHVRQGAHGVTDYDWERFLDFADQEM